jgi:hypothetical protein
MKKNQNTITEPILLVDDHHGIYMGKFAWEILADRYKKQAIAQGFDEQFQSDISNVENEFYCDACDKLTSITFKTPSRQRFRIIYSDGGMWIISLYVMRSKQYKDFFNN